MGIEATGLTRHFGRRMAVDHVDLRVREGEVLVLLGPNGAGKTTTVRMIAALLRPSGGTCRVAGVDVTADPDRVRRAVGLMTDVPGLYPDMSLRSYLRWFGGLYGMTPQAAAARADALVGLFGLGPWTAAPLGTLSRGAQQKVGLARCLLHEPTVLLLDEPTASLDVETTVTFRGLIRVLKQQGRTILLCTHNLAEAEKVADVVAILVGGRIVHTQPVRAGRQRDVELLLVSGASVAPDLIEACPGVLPGSVSVEGPRLRFATNDPATANPAVAATVIRAGWGIIRLAETGETLEDLYLRYLGAADQ